MAVCSMTAKPHTAKRGNMALTDTFVKNVKYTGAPAGDKHTVDSSVNLSQFAVEF